MVKIKVIEEFRDAENDFQRRKVGEIIECSPERADKILSRRFAVIIDEPTEKSKAVQTHKPKADKKK
jgi:hypothetical protein